MVATPIKRLDLKPAAKVQVATDVLWASWIGRFDMKYFGFVWLELFDEGVVVNKCLQHNVEYVKIISEIYTSSNYNMMCAMSNLT